MGAYHTLDLEVNRRFTLAKSEWDSVALERVDTACDPTQVCNSRCIRKLCDSLVLDYLI
jgi:stalled ribosome rescue protein Dom34